MDKRLESFDVLNSVIFLMCSDKSHIYFLVDEEHNGYNAIIVSLDVKDISVIAHIVYGVESLFDIGKTVPVCLTNS